MPRAKRHGSQVELTCLHCGNRELVPIDELRRYCSRCLREEAIQSELVLDPWAGRTGGTPPDPAATLITTITITAATYLAAHLVVALIA